MNYQRHYGALIERAKARETLDGYSERHHIVPKCMGGGDEQSNMVALTAEEHFVAHQLLVKINPGVIDLVLAANMMTISPTGRRNNNRRYAWIKKALRDATSKRFKGRTWTAEQNEARSKRVKAQWADKAFRDARKASMASVKHTFSPEGIAAIAVAASKQMHARWDDDEYRAKKTLQNRINRQKEEVRRAVSAQFKGKKLSDEHKARISAAQRKNPQQLLKGAE